MEERNVNTWEEFEKELKDLREERDKSNEFHGDVSSERILF
jgi:hypothetical protein